jgi:hypothetical protein
MAKTTNAAKKVSLIRLLIADCEWVVSLLDLPCRVEMYETQHIWRVIQLTDPDIETRFSCIPACKSPFHRRLPKLEIAATHRLPISQPTRVQIDSWGPLDSKRTL